RIDFEEMEARNLLLFEDETTRGELGSGAIAFARPTEDPLRNQFVATVNIDQGANLQFRITPDSNAESLGLIPSGTQLIVTARDASGDWFFVEFENQTGWISSSFVRLTFNGEVADVDELPIDG
ncbi:MAG: SH3 domain-containing protein, partial [Chloroflexota bacterium]